MLPPNMEIWYGNIVSYVRACMSLFTITSNLSPKSCEKRGHDAACSFFRGQETHLQSHSAFNWYDVFTTMTLSFGPVIFPGTQYGRSAGDRSIPRQRPPFATCNLVKSTSRPRQPARINQRCRNALPLVYLCLPLPFP